MHKLINVAGKIKAFRETLGMTQTEFIIAVSQKLAETTPNKLLAAKLRSKPLNPSLASQWESNLKNRASPSAEQLKAIALLSDRPWGTRWWFMRDDIDYKRGYELYPDGTANIAPPDLSAEDEEAMLSAVALDQSRHEAPPSKELTAWMRDEDKMWDLHVKGKFSAEEQNRQRRMLGILSLLPHEPCPSCGGINSNIVKKCDYCGHKFDAQTASLNQAQKKLIEPLNQGGLSAVGVMSTNVPVQGGLSAVGSMAPNVTAQGGLSAVGLMAPRGQVVDEYVDFPPQPFSLSQGIQIDVEGWKLKTNSFWTTVKYFANNDHYIPEENFLVRIQLGELSQLAHYFDGDRTVKVQFINRNTEIRNLKRYIQDHLMELCFIDRMKKRTARKMVLISTFETDLNLERLEEHLKPLINSSELIGVQVQFASGPVQVAKKIAAFKIDKTPTD